MALSVFGDKAHRPTADELERTLGKVGAASAS